MNDPSCERCRSLHAGLRARSGFDARRFSCGNGSPRALWLLLLLAHAPLALAWGPQGHRTVGAIADRLLTPEARTQVQRLLADDRDKFGNPSGRTTLEAVSVWSDEIYGTPAARPRWHYDNTPVCGPVLIGAVCRDGDCASEQLKRLSRVMADAQAAPRERNEALKWVVHLVADLHQPLHAADNADRGGNDVQVALAGVKTRGRESLHRAWDNDFVRLALQARDHQQPPADLGPLVSGAQTLLGEAGAGDPDSWASESNHLARNVAYRYPGFACGAVPQHIVVLDQAYVASAADLVRERLLLAGARLANLLNRRLGGGR
ncbi:MAG TPA: S1/P1 nuclease [Steroidobacteraceae bacterium]|nr:S1/P1 nuclease [Steroidobacteraceae bacterium]